MKRKQSSPFAALLSLHFRSIFVIHPPTRTDLSSPKLVLKTFGWILLAVLLTADIGFVFGIMDVGMYRGLAPLGMESFMLLNAIVTSSVIVFLFAFITSLSFFSSAQYETLFLSMPLTPSQLLTARMATVYAIEAPFGFLIMAIAAGVYGIQSHPGLGFYIQIAINALALPLVPLALSYAVLVPIMTVSRWLRRKNTLVYIGGFVGLVLALGFNLYLQSMLAQIQNPARLQQLLSGNRLNFAGIANWWPPAWLAMHAIEGSVHTAAAVATGVGAGTSGMWGRVAGAVAATLGNVALGLGLVGAVARIFGRGYSRTLINFGESFAVKGKIGVAQASSVFRMKSIFSSLVQREIRLMNREPMYFLNGPFVILLLPVIFALTLAARSKEIVDAVAALRPYLVGSPEYLIPTGLGIFLATSTSIACTAFSRDAKSIYFLKSLPIRRRDLVASKLVHALIFAALGIVLGTLGGAILLGDSLGDTLVALLLAILGAGALNMGALVIDTFHPKLNWESPMSALKQNPNSVIVILGTMGLLGGLGVLSAALPSSKYFFAILYGTVFVLACALLGLLLFRSGVRRVGRMEP